MVDPDGRPFAGAPHKAAGGVFTATLGNRKTQQIPSALTQGAVGNTLLGKSPDGSGRAVFAVALADGSLVQVHVVHAPLWRPSWPMGVKRPALSATFGSCRAPRATPCSPSSGRCEDPYLYEPKENTMRAPTITPSPQEH